MGSKKALIGMSGGVDSSVAAYLMQTDGYDCIGATMMLHSDRTLEAGGKSVCGSRQDAEDANTVADKLGIPFHVLDYSACFESEVIDRFVLAYEEGRTPNPCVDCNRYLKFEKMFDGAKALGCDLVVTGHYAKIEYCTKTDRYLLKRAADPDKDQSYFLWSLSQKQLSHAKFPLGKMTKNEIRAIAKENGFITARKRDSQDICFVPNGKYVEFLEKYTKKTYPEGDFLSTDGRVLGRHKGIIRYTVGQKKGLGVVLPEPLYVKSLNAIENTVTLCRSEELFSTVMTLAHVNLISLPEIKDDLRCKVKIRYRHEAALATVKQIDADRLLIVFDEPQRAVTRGQSAVMYDGDIVVGGGIIE